MKKRGILNAQLSYLIASLGHKETFLIGDAGMPIPAGVEVVDLALKEGVPSFEQVFDAILEDVEVEAYTLAEEIQEANPRLHKHITEKLQGIESEYILHEELKQKSAKCKFAIRTGEFSPYPNVILRAGVVF